MARRRRYLSDDERSAIVDGYRSGVSTYQLGAQYGINRQTVSVIVEDHGHRTRYRVLGHEQIKTASRLYKSGKSLQTLAAELGVGTTTVRVALLASGVQMRSRGGGRRGDDRETKPRSNSGTPITFDGPQKSDCQALNRLDVRVR